MAAWIRCFTIDTGFINSDRLAAPIGVTRLNRGSLIATAHTFAFRGFAYQIAPIPRPVGYLANGSFQGELLSVHKTKPVSLTHRRSQRQSGEG